MVSTIAIPIRTRPRSFVIMSDNNLSVVVQRFVDRLVEDARQHAIHGYVLIVFCVVGLNNPENVGIILMLELDPRVDLPRWRTKLDWHGQPLG
ncbi:hypothetical protein [Marinivivus vitaminiproducens]|uniref:hypothetical protein n=1 Tax=Marinivivus vitaminiproducens TaxID=3035935 RepID=UPI00279C23A7|nr:hypothetical protein P4R82_25040 [Geminicoccaceae bacterium SCSIO 64248]